MTEEELYRELRRLRLAAENIPQAAAAAIRKDSEDRRVHVYVYPKKVDMAIVEEVIE